MRTESSQPEKAAVGKKTTSGAKPEKEKARAASASTTKPTRANKEAERTTRTPVSGPVQTGGTLAADAPEALEIARRAYEFWEAGGQQHGNSEAHWYQAEREIRSRRVMAG